MMLSSIYESPLGPMLMAGSDDGLVGLWFIGQKHLPDEALRLPAGDCRAFDEARLWLDAYFAGKSPDMAVPLDLRGTAFQLRVWAELRTIPYGGTLSYGQLASRLGCRSARAVGAAVGRNPVSIIVPCHRVMASDGRLTGYAGGLQRKEALLRLEGVLRS